MRVLMLIGLWLFSTLTQANMYLAVGANYSKVEQNQLSEEAPGYSLALGYQFHRQWYLEAGFAQWLSRSADEDLPNTLAGVADYQSEQQWAGPYVALLGKATGQQGELFYRVGVTQVDSKAEQLVAGNTCELGESRLFTVEQQPYSRCMWKESLFAGIIGLGFDFFLSKRTQLRLEADYLKGQDDFSLGVVSLALRYNF